MANIEELAHSYHNLPGTLMKDKKKSLENFIHDVQSKITSEHELNALISALSPKNDHETMLMMDVLIHFKKYERLLSILKESENPRLIGKILKCGKFFEEIFKYISPDEFVNALLPNTSFSTRMKIINRLSKNLKDEQLADDYFQAIEEKYGLRVATAILPACSKYLIENQVAKYKIKLTMRQLMYIVKKHTDFLYFYFEILYKTVKYFNYYNYKRVIKYVAKADAELFWMLYAQYEFQIKFGKNMTTSLLENKKELVAHHEKCTHFDKKQVYKIVRKNDEDFKQFFLSYFPPNVDTFENLCLYKYSALNCFLNYVSKQRRYVLLNDSFKMMYGKNLHDYPGFANEHLLSIMPQRIREGVLKTKVREDDGLIYMFNTKRSVPTIKDRIKRTSDIENRNNYVLLLYKTCEFNKDESALLSVLKYLCNRHKNDTGILNNFMQQLLSWPDLEKLSDKHWKVINEVLEISTDIKKMGYLEKYFVHLYESNKPTEEHMQDLFKYVLETFNHITVFNKNQKYQKMCLERFGVLIQQTLTGLTLKNWSKLFLVAIVSYNETNTSDEIPILNYKDMLNFTESDIKDDYLVRKIIIYCVKKELDGFDLIFWENYKILRDHNMVLRLSKKNPYRIVENLHHILSNNFPEKHIDTVIFALEARLPNSNIQNELVKFFTESVQMEKFKTAVVPLIALSHLATCDEFFNYVEWLYPPPDGKIDVNENSEKVLLQECVMKSLTNLKNPSETLTILLKFCKGDYLKYALAPLYTITSRTRENIIPGFLEELFNSAVSVRKHAVMLTKLLLPQQAIHSFLEQQASKEKHPSLKKAILKKTLEYFVQNPSETFWNLLCTNINIISDKDREAHDGLLKQMDNIPVEYLPQYVPIVYEKFSKNPDREIQLKKYDLLDVIPDAVIQHLDANFLTVIIKDTLFNANADSEQSGFYFKCIFYHSGAARMKFFDFVFEYFKKYVEKNWTTIVHGNIRRTIYIFVSTFCSNCVKFKADKKIIQEFIDRWSMTFKPEDIIEQYILLLLTSAYFTCDFENFPVEFGVKANEILVDLVNRYDLSIIAIYSGLLLTFLTQFANVTTTNKKLYLFMESFMSVNPTRQTYIVTCDLLKTCRFTDEPSYKTISECIQNLQDPVVEMHYKYLLQFID